MASPAKKRKLNSDTKKGSAPAKGLEYFFAKQKQNGAPKPSSSSQASGSRAEEPEGKLTDEELARKLQAEWNAEPVTTPRGDDMKPGAAKEGSPSEERMEPESTSSSQLVQIEPSLANPGPSVTHTLSLSSVAATDDKAASLIPLDESPLTFNPSKYIAELQESWAGDGGDASYALLTRCFVLVNGTQSRIKIVDTLVNCIRVLIEGDPSSLLPAVWLATNAISPPYSSMELGLGGSAISKALKQVCGLDNRSLKAIYDKLGDPGDVAFEAKKKQSFTLRKPKPLTIKGVFQSLAKIAKTQGQGSGDVKQRIVDRLLQDARGGEESRYIVRTLCQHLRIGAVKTTMLIALSRAFLLSKPPGAEFPTRNPQELAKLKKEELAEVWAKPEEILKACFARHPDYNDLVPVLLEIGISDELLVRCGLTLHIPLRPMLGSITRDLSEMLTKLQGRDFTCEYKYDGQRAQVHCDAKGKVSIFSRHLELMTDKYPDLVALVPKIRGEGVESFIMEGEVVAMDQATGDLKTFQTLTNRARKDVAIGSITIDVCLFAFDLMYLNGQPLLDRSFRDRRDMLKSLFMEVPYRFTWVKNLDATSNDAEAVLEFFKSATENKCEGIMVKILDNISVVEYGGDVMEPAGEESAAKKLVAAAKKAKGKGKGKAKAETENGASEPKSSRRKPLLATYEPDKRLDSWLKVKKDYHASFDTLDLIPIAGWHGQGRKAKWWSPILLAVRNEETGSLEAVCKCISGFTDAFYKANKEFYDDGENGEPNNTHLKKPSYVEYTGGHPDVWFEPQEVWEMAFADITISPTYTAAIGLVQEDKGLSLRFPRFMKKREDKGIDEASTNQFLAGLWRKQETKAPAAGKDAAVNGEIDMDEDDF
ncbi:ATP-dependent DNA ligase [Lasiosphaeria miniovina]|uniref:DNA ligase n=1 Tax=Lasiosphaeria miniovina TaxID=1954250 RepID=A0AA40AC66_9PEZI|nr:ATP-dependent DNA ligase [Lasiosphaeria miniovina]KAK0713205.1 ATP-dependent DNA ligase [Lasiosphaeria miniovina]